MPLELPAPIEQPARVISAQTIGPFICDPEALTVTVRIKHLDQNGEHVPEMDFDFTSQLVNESGPRFSAAFYDELKALIYRLGIEDGHLSGTVV